MELSAACLPDAAALFFAGGIALLYHLFIARRRKLCPLRTVQGVASAARKDWVASVVRGRDGILGVQTLRNSTMVASFMASTSSVLALGVLSLAASAGDRTGAWRLLHIFGTPSPDLLVLKVLALLLVLFFAFFCFASSIRLYGHAGFMIGTCSAPGEEERRIHVSAACLEQAARQFHLGMRAFYFLVPLVLWLFGPVFLALGAMGMLLALYRLDRMPSGVERGKLELPCRKDIDCRG